MGFWYIEQEKERLEEQQSTKQTHDNVVSVDDYRKPANLNQEDLAAEEAVEMQFLSL